MRLFLLCLVVGLIGAAGCTRPASERDSGSRTDMGTAPTPDVGTDAASTSCTTDAQCNDSISCTIDQCVVGNVCSHTPIDAMCTGAGEHCSLTMGCTTMMMTTCTTAADCDDHVYCNGVEQCLLPAHCAPGLPRDCDDGNSCTIDSCDDSLGRCVYTTTCDSGIVATDTGPVCTPFVAPGDFNGTFFIAPAQNQGCGVTSYSLSRIVLTVSGTTATATGLTVQGGNVTMMGTVTGNAFDVTYSGCGTYHLTGTFDSCRESFTGHWTAMYGGGAGCGTCTTMNADITGLRSGA